MTDAISKSVSQTECPSTDYLRRWLNGQEELAQADEYHVQGCVDCQALLSALTEEESLLSLAHGLARSEVSFATEPEYVELKALLNNRHASQVGFETPRPADSTVDSQEIDSWQPLSLERLERSLPSGRFLVRRIIASGGSGVVYQAYDKRLQRDVAIKLLSRNSYRDRARFMREARLLADLVHPNIIRVYESGVLTASGTETAAEQSVQDQLYMVMEYVGGGTALILQPQLIDQPEANSTASRTVVRMGQKYPDYVQLARLLAGAAEGLQIAHDKQLVHRDIKPGNLLLTEDQSTLKVGDFGLARVSNESATQVTRTGDLLGTPAFMSPEQFAGEDQIDAASDIYSMGATLYQLLVGLPPYQGNSAAIARQVMDTDPVNPRMLNPHVPFEMEVICMHAMAKEPARRYASMRELAEDLHRFATGQPIHARPVSSSTKAWYFLKRNPSLAGALFTSVVLALVLAVGGSAVALLFRQQNIELAKAAAAESVAKESAQQSRRQAIDAANELLVAVTEDADLLPRAPGSEEVSKKLLMRAQQYYQQMISAQTANQNSDDRLDFDIARAHAGLARVAQSLGDHAIVERESQRALDLLSELPVSVIDEAQRIGLMCRTLNVLGKSYVQREDFQQAIDSLRRSQLLSESQWKQNAADQEIVYLLAESLRGRAMAENASGQLDSAENALMKAVALVGSSPRMLAGDSQHLRLAAAIETTLAVTLLRREGHAIAKEHLERAMDLLDRLKVNGFLPTRIRRDNATNIVNLAMVEAHLRNFTRAEELFNLAEEEYRQLTLLEPNVAEHKMSQAVTILNSGRVYVAKNDLETIRGKYLHAESLVRELLEKDPSSANNLGTLGMIQSNLAIFSQMQGRSAEAIPPLIAATETMRKYAELVENTPDSLHAIALNYYELSKCYFDLKQYDESEEALANSMRMTQQVLAQEAGYLDSLCHQVDEWALKAELACASEKIDAQSAMKLAREAVAWSEALLAKDIDLPEYRVRHGSVLATVAEAYMKAGQPQSAQRQAEEAIEYLRSVTESPLDETATVALQANYEVLVRAVSANIKALQETEDLDLQQQLNQLKRQLVQAQTEMDALEQ